MNSKEFAEANKDAMVDKIQNLLKELGVSDFLLVASIPLEDPSRFGLLTNIPSPSKLYELTTIFVTALYKSGNHKAIVSLAHGLEEAMNSVSSDSEESAEVDEPKTFTVAKKNRVLS